MTRQLEEARAYEEKTAKEIKKQERPHVHLTPYCGWMNDPNGFSFYKEKVHLFYQYAPYDTVWGPMHWGHAVTSDLCHWEYLPCVMAPDTDADKDGCFSGSAITMPDGRQKLFYTGVTGAEELQVQCTATGDGENYEKSADNPVIDPSMLPEGYARQDFRDPKIWRDDTGTYRMVVSARNAEGDGEILLFSSKDSETWAYTSVLFQGERGAGVMLECPDLFCLNGTDVLIVSPMGGKSTAYLGTLDKKTWTFHPKTRQQVDLGPDLYAPQTMEMPDGRRILIGWMQSWATVEEKTRGRKIAGQMTIPRELSVQDRRLIQRPVRELFSAAEQTAEKEISTSDGALILTCDPKESAWMFALEGETTGLTVLLDRFGMEVFHEGTGEVFSESFAAQQCEWHIPLPVIGVDETMFQMKQFVIS